MRMKPKYKNSAGVVARALRDRAGRPMPVAAVARARDAVAYAAALEILG